MASTTRTIVESATVLGKRKARTSLILRLTSSPEPTDSDFIPEIPTSSNSKHILVNGVLVNDTKNRYRCTFDGCGKAYAKPSRLEEHERTHIGLRPFVCGTCQKSYFRENHLHAHIRSHLPESDRPFACARQNCSKRFWTTQHLKVHETWHDGAKIFECNHADCSQTFTKHNQLRAHVCAEHSPPGTKPYQCTHAGCTKSFDTNQHLKTHGKTHEEKRYTCIHLSCLPNAGSPLVYYPTWTSLQHHMRTAHPPTCPHPSCKGKTFTSQKGLRAHEKIHQEREVEAALDPETDEEQPRKRRRGGEIGRDCFCPVEGCAKDFKSKKALNTHNNVTHLGRKDFVCQEDGCQRAFGYKHLLQRHCAKAHNAASSSFANEYIMESSEDDTTDAFDLDAITGNLYKQRANSKFASSTKMLRCPYSNLAASGLVYTIENAELGGEVCDYVFSRAYDIRRHLNATHGVATEKEDVERWVKTWQAQKL